MAESDVKGKAREARAEKPRKVPEVFSVVVECRDEEQQREIFERLLGEGVRVRLLVL